MAISGGSGRRQACPMSTIATPPVCQRVPRSWSRAIATLVCPPVSPHLAGFIVFPAIWILTSVYLQHKWRYTAWIHILTHIWLLYYYVTLSLR